MAQIPSDVPLSCADEAEYSALSVLRDYLSSVGLIQDVFDRFKVQHF